MVSTYEQTTVDLLAERLIRDGNVEVLRDVMTGQIELVTRLEMENAALRKASVRFASAVSSVEVMEPHVLDAYGALLDVLYPPDALVTFPAEHGIPLPGEGVA